MMPKLDGAIIAARGRHADSLEARLAEVPGWDEMPDREHLFLVAYACTGEKAEALRLIHRHATWCYDRRFRTQAFMDLVTAPDGERLDYIASTRGRLLEEAIVGVQLLGVMQLGAILEATPSRGNGVTAATQLKAIRLVLQMNGFI